MSKTRTIKLSTNLLSISCAIRLISFLMMSSLISELFSQNLSFRYPLRRKRGYLKEKKPWPSYSQDLNSPDYFLRGYLLWKQSRQSRQDIIRKEIRRIAQEMLYRAVDSFIVPAAAVLSYSRAVHGTNIILIIEKV